MNATNRAVNRTILLVGGLVLVGAGASAMAALVWPVAADVWRAVLSSATEWMRDADLASRLPGDTVVSWFVVGVLAVLAVLVASAVFVVARLGGGRSSTVIRDESGVGVQGPITIRQGFASDALTQSLARHDEILASRVTARRVRGIDVLHVSVTPRQNTSPMATAEKVSRLIDNLATLSGQEVPTLVSIRSSVRARLAAGHSRVD